MKNLEERIKNQPEYKIGQAVKVIVKSKSDKGFEFNNEVEGYISVIRATGTSEINTYEYGITTDMPACYHSGRPPFEYILEQKIELANP